MKCSCCGKNFKPLSADQDACEKCQVTIEELSNGKDGDEDE
jgi:hypothetical protein